MIVACITLGATAANAAWTPGAGATGTSAGLTLGLPTSPAATATSSTTIHVTWTAPSSGPAPAQYVVRRTAPTTATVCTVSAPTVACDDTGLSPSTTYSYTVQSRIGTNWVSGQTAAVSATTSNPPTLNVSLSGTKTAGTAFNVTLTATTNGTTTDTSYTGSKTITFSGPSDAPSGATPTYPASVTFFNGVGTATPITLKAAETVTLDATDGTISGSTSVTVVAGERDAAAVLELNAELCLGHRHRGQRRLVHHQGDGLRRLPQPEERHHPHGEPDAEPDQPRLLESDEPRDHVPELRDDVEFDLHPVGGERKRHSDGGGDRAHERHLRGEEVTIVLSRTTRAPHAAS